MRKDFINKFSAKAAFFAFLDKFEKEVKHLTLGFKTLQLLFELEQHLHGLRHFSAVFGPLGRESITFHVS